MTPALSRRACALLLLVLIGLWFGPLDFRKLIKPDEGRYAEIPREMVASGDWLTPRLNGLKYFEKPPLQYWATASAYEIAGQHERTARLWPALTGFLGILLAGFTATRLFGRGTGMLAAMVQASGLLYLGMGHINTLDMGLTFFLQLMFSAFLLAQHEAPGSRGERRWMLAAWAAAALAVMSKGLVSLVLPGATLVLYSLLTRDISPWRRLHPAKGLAVFLLIAAPWHIAVSLANPEFARFYFIHEHFERFLTTAHRRGAPWWFFIPIISLGALPWTGMMIHATIASWKSADDTARASRFLVIWAAFTFVFFSISNSKLPSYVLPMLPALALLTGAWLAAVAPRTLMRHMAPIGVLALLALVALPAITRYADAETPLDMIHAYREWLVVSAALWLTGCVVAMWLLRRGQSVAALIAFGLGGGLAWTGTVQGHEMLGRSSSAYFIAQEIKHQVRPEAPFYSVNTYEQTLPFYLNRTLTLVHFRDELDFGLKQQPELGIPTEAAFKQRWLTDREAWAVMTPAKFEQLQREGLPMHVAARDTRRVIVRKP